MAAGLFSCLSKEKINMSPVAALKFDFQPKYDEEYLTIEERILINLEIIVINNLLAGVRTAEAKITDFDA